MPIILDDREEPPVGTGDPAASQLSNLANGLVLQGDGRIPVAITIGDGEPERILLQSAPEFLIDDVGE